MGKEDEVLKRYLSDDECYADLINGVSFGGRQVVTAEDLSDRDTQTGYHKNTRAVKGKKHTKYRDLYPCITIVLYYGDDWDGSTDLHGLLDFTNIPEELRDMVANYKINLPDIKKLERTDIFHTDLKQVFDVMAVFTKSAELAQLRKAREGEEIDMCKALQDWASEERSEGKIEGKIEGRFEERLENLRAIMANLKLTAEAAMDILNVPLEERVQYLAKMQ